MFRSCQFQKSLFPGGFIRLHPKIGPNQGDGLWGVLQSSVNNDVFGLCTKACKNWCFLTFSKSGVWYVNNGIIVRFRGPKLTKACKNCGFWSSMWAFVVNTNEIFNFGLQMSSSGLQVVSSGPEEEIPARLRQDFATAPPLFSPGRRRCRLSFLFKKTWGFGT